MATCGDGVAGAVPPRARCYGGCDGVDGRQHCFVSVALQKEALVTKGSRSVEETAVAATIVRQRWWRGAVSPTVEVTRGLVRWPENSSGGPSRSSRVEHQGGKAAGRRAAATVVAGRNAAAAVGLAESRGGRVPFRPDGLQREEDLIVAGTAQRRGEVAGWGAAVVVVERPRSSGGGGEGGAGGNMGNR
ncbi:hypothetical protein C4D60_Mb08t15830 [Musa balbisiana]|uniref:Uncharacterized protein n=1 Tax=Musa balbisiana TaxID=52838 RepID=A0A4S8K443_MUSBA|nr:hypothetical protein C4D60_Mb08t15830 [Musa balbisiana]